MVGVDISQIAGSGIVMFSAETPAADLWMRELYGRAKIYFHLPADQARALAFIDAAMAHKFSIGSLESRAE